MHHPELSYNIQMHRLNCLSFLNTMPKSRTILFLLFNQHIHSTFCTHMHLLAFLELLLCKYLIFHKIQLPNFNKINFYVIFNSNYFLNIDIINFQNSIQNKL